MGYLFLPDSLRVDPVPETGCWLEVNKERRRLVTSLFRLELDPQSPLTPRSGGSESLSDRDPRFELRAGVWWCTLARSYVPETNLVKGIVRLKSVEPVYLVVSDGRLRLAASKADAYCALGAAGALQALGLEDAAISLLGGDFDHASVQVIAHRERSAALEPNPKP